jgi:hypothetical protein
MIRGTWAFALPGGNIGIGAQRRAGASPTDAEPSLLAAAPSPDGLPGPSYAEIAGALDEQLRRRLTKVEDLSGGGIFLEVDRKEPRRV